jgi:hypothetical protein
VTGVVDQIQVTDNVNYSVTGFTDSSDVQLGWWYTYHQVLIGTTLQNVWSFFQRLSKPSTDSSFRAPDGSRWDYVGSSLYYCWGRGTTYAPGAIFYRGGVTGGLTPII